MFLIEVDDDVFQVLESVSGAALAAPDLDFIQSHELMPP